MKKQDRNVRMSAFRYDGSFYTITGKVFDLVVVNLLWIVGCIPVVTAGASCSALYHVVMESVRKGETTVFREFWRVWKRDLKETVPVWLCCAVLYFVLFLNLGIAREQPASNFFLFCILLFAFLLVWLTVLCTYLFPAIATFQMPVLWNVKLAVFLSVKHLPLSLMLAAMFAVVYFSMMAVPLLVLVLPGVFTLFSSYILEPVFEKHMPKG